MSYTPKNNDNNIVVLLLLGAHFILLWKGDWYGRGRGGRGVGLVFVAAIAVFPASVFFLSAAGPYLSAGNNVINNLYCY